MIASLDDLPPLNTPARNLMCLYLRDIGGSITLLKSNFCVLVILNKILTLKRKNGHRANHLEYIEVNVVQKKRILWVKKKESGAGTKCHWDRCLRRTCVELFF